jgi:SH3-like domain-containing protein
VKFPSTKLFISAFALMALSACGRRHQRVLETDYVSAPQVTVRDQLAQVYNKVGTLKNGDRVEVLDREKRFARIRTPAAVEGWVEQRFLVSQQIFDAFQKLAQGAKDSAVEGTATTRNETNLHVEPGRDTEHLYQLSLAAKVSILKRATVEKTVPGAASKPITGAAKDGKPMEDWWLVRDSEAHVGWVLGRMLDLDVPLEVAQYAEGQRIVACFQLNQVTDGDKKVAQYLVLMNEPKDGMPFDFNQARVFTWNVRKHRYETAYRERKLNGVLPVTVSEEDFGKEGKLPIFILRVKDDAGNVLERKYKMNTPIVRRVQ